MSVKKVKEYLKDFGLDDRVEEFTESSATVELAAKAAGVIPAMIAKTLSFKLGDSAVLIVTSGDMKIDNPKFKQIFGTKAKMLTPDEAIEFTGHAVGGVCPFALANDSVRTYLDISLKRFDTVLPAAGSSSSCVRLSPDELELASKAVMWADICKPIEEKPTDGENK